MRSDIYTEKYEMAAILSEVDKISSFCSLSPSEAGKLRLLSEEMLVLTVRLFENLKYEFYIENEGKHFTLNLKADTFVNESQRDKMLSLSSDGKNKSTKGLFGKISGVFEALLMNEAVYDRISMPYYDCMGMDTYFSLSVYRDELPQTAEDKQEEQWDGLEKSIIANLAKDVIIGVRNSKAEMIVTIEF